MKKDEEGMKKEWRRNEEGMKKDEEGMKKE